MKIGIDARVLGTSRALDRYTRNLISQLAVIKTKHRFVIFLREGASPDKLRIPKADNFEYAFFKANHSLFEHLTLAFRLKKYQLDVLFHPDNKSLLWCRIPQVTTLHDLTPQKFPGLVLSKDTWIYIRQKLYFLLQNKALSKNARIITVSKNTKRDVVSFLGLDVGKVAVVYEGVEKHFAPQNASQVTKILKKYQIEKPYLFYLGGFGRHKNVLSVLRAFVSVKGEFEDLKLVLGGKANDSGSSGQNIFSELRSFVEANHIKKRAQFPGFVAEEDLPAIYSGAKVFVYPSKYEGFGFPPLEAMACGTPVVCSKAASLPEVGGEAVVYAQSVSEIAFSVTQILKSATMQKELSQKSLKQAKKFKWSKCARETLKIVESI